MKTSGTLRPSEPLKHGMNSEALRFQPTRIVCWAALLFLAIVVPSMRAQILWTGPMMGFTQSVANSTSRDTIVPGIQVTRNFSKWLYNPAATPPETVADGDSPAGTLWAFGSLTNNLGSLNFMTMSQHHSLAGGFFDTYLLNKAMVLKLVSSNIYIDVVFKQWPHGGGAFGWLRSTAPVAAPTVSITNPVGGAVFAAPAAVQVQASAAVSGGTVTNVAFFGNGSSLGSDQTSPFGITTSPLGAGAYALTAVATAGGISATSSVVNITVVAPTNITLSSQALAGTQFSFDYTANSGLRYVAENSSNLLDWVSLSTNVAGSTLVHYTDTVTAGANRYYRVGRLPNP